MLSETIEIQNPKLLDSRVQTKISKRLVKTKLTHFRTDSLTTSSGRSALDQATIPPPQRVYVSDHHFPHPLRNLDRIFRQARRRPSNNGCLVGRIRRCDLFKLPIRRSLPGARRSRSPGDPLAGLPPMDALPNSALEYSHPEVGPFRGQAPRRAAFDRPS